MKKQLVEIISIYQKRAQLCLLFILIGAIALPAFAISQEERNRALQCEKNLTIASRYENLVAEPVSGLYQSIPIKSKFKFKKFNFITIKDEIKVTPEGEDFEMSTEIFDRSHTNVGSIKRWFSKNSTEIIFSDARFNDDPEGEIVPSFLSIPGSISLVEGRGIPTQAFVTLMQMKMAGVPYGGLTHAETGAISNYETSLELIHDPTIQNWIMQNPDREVPGALIAGAILKTSTGRYISTVLTQSGHRIAKIEVTEVKMWNVYDRPTTDKMEADKYIRLLRMGLTHLDKMPTEFRLNITLEPRDPVALHDRIPL